MTPNSRFDGMLVNRVHPRHISSALMVCQPFGFTHRRIHRASPRVSGHPVSPIHSARPVSLSVMHVHWGAAHMETGIPFDLRSYLIPTNSPKLPASFALLVCPSVGFTHRRIRRVSPLYLTTRSRPLTQPVQSLCPLCMFCLIPQKCILIPQTTDIFRFAGIPDWVWVR